MTTHEYTTFLRQLEEYTGQPHKTVIKEMTPCDPEAAAAQPRFTGPSEDLPHRCMCGHPIAFPTGFTYTDPTGKQYPFLIGSVCIQGFVKEDPNLSDALTLTLYRRCLREGCSALIDKIKDVKNECCRYYCPGCRVGHSSIRCTRCYEKTPFVKPKLTMCPDCYQRECRKKQNLALRKPGERGCAECGRLVQGNYETCYKCKFPTRCPCGMPIKSGYKTCFGCSRAPQPCAGFA